MVCILWNDLSVKFNGVCDFDGIRSMGPQEQLCIVKVVKIIHRVAGAEFNTLYLLKVDIIYLLSPRCHATETDTVK